MFRKLLLSAGLLVSSLALMQPVVAAAAIRGDYRNNNSYNNNSYNHIINNNISISY